MEYLKKKKTEEQVQESITETVAKILEDIQEQGDTAVRNYSKIFDKWEPVNFQLSQDEIQTKIQDLPTTFMEDTKFVAKQIENFARAQKESMKEFEIETHPGIFLGQKLVPVQSVGNYVPGGRYPLLASALMSTIPPRVAGVNRIASFSPPLKDGTGIHPKIIFALHHAGSDKIYALGGVQAIGAMAYGTETIKQVDMIVGPGNAFVAEAKRQLYGKVGIDLPAGPSEILIIADESADSQIVAADLLAQAEHDTDARAILITTSKSLAEEVLRALKDQLQFLPTSEVAGRAWDFNGEIIVVDSYEEAAELSDSYAIEHLEVQTTRDDWFFKRLKNYGSLFLGEESTVVYSDKAIGTNHILPTMGAARYTGGVWVGKFIKNVTYQKLTKAGSLFIAPYAVRQSDAEGMPGHRITAEKRIAKYNKK